jgi:hypothetical protein
MKFAYFGLVSLLALALMSTVSFADISAPPPSLVTVTLMNNGANYTGIGQITYICTASLYDPNAQKAFPLNCSAGSCVNEPQYTGSECGYYPKGYFTYAYQGQNKTSETFDFNDTFYRYIEYRLDVPSGKLTLVSASNDQNPQPGPCTTVFVLAAALALVVSKRG